MHLQTGLGISRLPLDDAPLPLHTPDIPKYQEVKKIVELCSFEKSISKLSSIIMFRFALYNSLRESYSISFPESKLLIYLGRGIVKGTLHD